MFDWFESYLSERSLYVEFQTTQSDTKPITHGVPQGSILGPILFIIDINDFSRVSEKLFSILYADDTSVFIEGYEYDKLIRTYMLKTCTERKQMNSTVFCDMVKPLISDKGSKTNTNITLIDDSKMINDPKDVCCILNQYFVNITRGIGIYDPIIESDTIDSILNAYSDQESALHVKNNLANPDHFHFAQVSPEKVLSVINSINVKKTTGYDMIIL